MGNKNYNKILLLTELIDCLKKNDRDKFMRLRGAIHYNFCKGQELNDEVIQIVPYEDLEAIHQTLIPLKNAATFSSNGTMGTWGKVSTKSAIKYLELLKDLYAKEYNDEQNSSNNSFIKDLLDISERLHRNYLYLDASENERNDYIRDNLLSKNYIVKDQSRQGESKNGKDAGELDLFVCENAMQQDVIIEGLNLFSCDTTKIKNHYEKIWGYDKSGNPLNVFLVYANVEDISQFSEKYKEYFESYKGEFPCESIAFEKYPYANIKVLSSKHKMNEKDIMEIKHIIILFSKKADESNVFNTRNSSTNGV